MASFALVGTCVACGRSVDPLTQDVCCPHAMREAPSPTSRGSQHSSHPTSTANAARSHVGHCSEPKSTGKSHDRREAPLEPQETIGRRADSTCSARFYVSCRIRRFGA